MFRTRLDNFTFSCGGRDYPAAAPTSLLTVLREAGEVSDPYYRDEYEKRLSPLMNECVIGARFDLSLGVSNLKYAYLKLPDIDTEAELVFNGRSVFRIFGTGEHILDVSGATVAGENTVSIRVPASDAPRDITLIGGIEFIAFSHSCISSVSTRTVFVADRVSVDVALELLGSGDDVKAVATLVSPSGKIYYGGVTNGHTVINVPDPLLWWPSGHGVQNLYKLSVNLYYGNESIDSHEVRLGLRSVFLDDRAGTAFTVNGAQLLGMGVEYRMCGISPVYRMLTRAQDIVSAASDAGMNLIRFLGEGRYPCEEFLNLCDSYGIAVEYVWGGGRTPVTDSEALMRELVCNFRRMSAHPSVICVSYIPSAVDAELLETVKRARDAALSSVYLKEYSDDGFFDVASLPDEKTLRAVCDSGDMNLFSYVMERHTESADDAARIVGRAAATYKYADGIKQLTYMSGLLQAHAAEAFADSVRVNRSSRGAAVISSLNDAQPSVSRAMIDFEGRYKIPYYLSKSFFAPVRLIVRSSGAAGVTLTVSNESKRSFAGIVEYSVKDAKNDVIFTSGAKVGAERCSVGAPLELDLSEYVRGHEREYYLECTLFGDSGRISTAAHLFVPPKHFEFADPVILSEISGSGREFTLACRASAFAKDVVFGFDGTDAVFKENCIDITDGSVRRIPFLTDRAMSVERLMSELSVMSVYSIGK